jgi:hypothetical protein
MLDVVPIYKHAPESYIRPTRGVKQNWLDNIYIRSHLPLRAHVLMAWCLINHGANFTLSTTTGYIGCPWKWEFSDVDGQQCNVTLKTSALYNKSYIYELVIQVP